MIEHNRAMHDVIAPLYEGRHREIFNPTEQLRIRNLFYDIMHEIATGSAVPLVLDYGAGTGNLTRHLLDQGADVVAAEVSTGCLRELHANLGNSERLETVLVNGDDLSRFGNETFDMVVTYSVLHHIPDYLGIVEEFARVLKPGGILYIDHEACPSYWNAGTEYQEYCKAIEHQQENCGQGRWRQLTTSLIGKGRWRVLLALLRLRSRGDVDEGDIHVYPNDHIDWHAIRKRLESGCEIIRESDYLVCREDNPDAPVWNRWRSVCSDMRLLVARKN